MTEIDSRLTTSATSLSFGKSLLRMAGQLLKASCASYAKGLALHAFCHSVHENTGFCGQTVSKSTSVHENVGSGGQDIKQPEVRCKQVSKNRGNYNEKEVAISRNLLIFGLP